MALFDLFYISIDVTVNMFVLRIWQFYTKLLFLSKQADIRRHIKEKYHLKKLILIKIDLY